MGHRMLKQKIFCIFCGDDDLKDKESAINHYWNHILNQVTPISKSTPPNKLSPSAAQVKDFARAWTSAFIDSLCSKEKWKDNFKYCPVCLRAGIKMKRGLTARKHSAERNHMLAHLKYQKFLCKICSDEDNITYAGNQLVAFTGSSQNKKRGTTVHRIKSTTPLKHFKFCKTTRRTVLNHIRKSHLGPAEGVETDGHVIHADQLVTEFEIYAVEELINSCSESGSFVFLNKDEKQIKKKLKKNKTKELVINPNESVDNLKMKIEPVKPEVLAQARNSLLKPNFNFSPIFEKSKKKSKNNSKTESKCKRKLRLSDTIFDSRPVHPRLSLIDHNYSVAYDQELDSVLEDLMDKMPELTEGKVKRRSYSRNRPARDPIPSSYSSILDMLHLTEDLEYFDINDDVLNKFTSELVIPKHLGVLNDINELINCDQ